MYRLRGLDEAATYAFTDIDTGKVTELTGADAMKRGIAIELPKTQQAALIPYKRK